MDDEFTQGYREACAQCACVDWGVSEEGRFFCRSCHNVIERTREVDSQVYAQGTSQVSTISRRSRTKKREQGRQWMVCEAFQFILRKQASALLELGVDPPFKDDVLWQLWRRFLQTSRLAYTHAPVRSSMFKVRAEESDIESGAESSFLSASETGGETDPPSTAESQADSCSDRSTCSLDGAAYLTSRLRPRRDRMSMTKTLALIHLALVWSRQALTLGDLLRLVSEGHVPYVNVYEELPKEMQLDGPDALIFRVQSVPSHRSLHREAEALARFLQLPAFPPIGRRDLLHPVLLSLRYLSDANLPDELHPWVCVLMERVGMAEAALHTVDPSRRYTLPQYDVQAAALIIVTMKLVFGLDDRTEWDFANDAGTKEHNLLADGVVSHDHFNLRRWYRLLHAALLRAEHTRHQDVARKQWKATPLYPNRKHKCVVMKKKRVAEQLQLCFQRLSSQPAQAPPAAPSTFRFCWGDEDGADGPSLHHNTLKAVVTLKQEVLTPVNFTYWHVPLRPCDPRKCGSHYSVVEATLPRSFVWLLKLFSFLLQVSPAHLYQEVLSMERRLLRNRTAPGQCSGKRTSGVMGTPPRTRRSRLRRNKLVTT
ncbi:TATA box-binding protein-associated factor RNA polymerase I subunit B isoform X2 [Dunckerocampus dactyliophorus]|uniref:TATA box-binding protein-associated factor RNA polymerase I subunit B isoform X2 n=1 Tax=Dunckerocampus dactyliophorus TaxID=161453 RepID=UPI0024055F98|nr:TATA box-binding protein-associated factor RNA polymerase I subunit B isoform X2 [Dunckerocampus dactyliophorus]